MPIYLWERDNRTIVERLRNCSTLKICAKVLDEPLFIEGWIEHHSRIVGYENLIIADNMSTDAGMLETYSRYCDKVTIFQFEGRHNEIHWHPRFAELFNAIKKSCRLFSFFDVDERLVRITRDHWKADASIIDCIDAAPIEGLIPTTWLINKLDSFERFSLTDPNYPSALANNLKWGKPILHAELVGSQAGIHNIQYERTRFARSESTELFLLHLTQFPGRRIEANRNKLASRGIVPRGASSKEVLGMDFSRLADQSFMPLVDEMRKMSDIIASPGKLEVDGDELRLERDGSVSFSSDKARAILSSYLDEGKEIIEATFQGTVAPDDKFADPSFLLDLAIELRSNGHHAAAERLFRAGMRLHPNFISKFRGPSFQKELLRMFLANQRWTEADELVGEREAMGDDRWHENSICSSVFPDL